MSREAIAAALARHDLSSGERLVAFSLASFADRENRARPGTPAAAARAGLERSWFLEARDLLVRRGLVVVEQAATGRGRASTLCAAVRRAEGPWWDGEINAELLEAVLGYSRSRRGTARLLLAAMAALADERRLRRGGHDRAAVRGGRGHGSDLPPGPGRAAGLGRVGPAWRDGRTGAIPTAGRSRTRERALPSVHAAESRRRVAPPSGQRPLLATVTTAPAVAQSRQRGQSMRLNRSRGQTAARTGPFPATTVR